jgi:hypothetical protein
MRKGFFIFLLLPCTAPLYAQKDTLAPIPMQQLDEVEILSGYEKYRLDSVRTATIYRKNIQDAQRKFKPKFSKEAIRAGEIGIYVPGGVSELADVLSGQKKKDKKLLKTIEDDMRDRYISIRYNQRSVSNAIGVSDEDSLQVFMNAFPMQEEFARTASPLELKMWVRYNYKQWLNRPKDSLPTLPVQKQ